ncbi:MAG: hypothetical protein QOH71_2323 [Blastocatellia bacterium]|nr:hypothetical protein [Blastocatellia bacterium]
MQGIAESRVRRQVRVQGPTVPVKVPVAQNGEASEVSTGSSSDRAQDTCFTQGHSPAVLYHG